LAEGEEGASPQTQYSRAFDNIVQDEEDVVGLLAYALYKRAIREDAQQGQRSNGDTRNPSRTVVETYRQAAERTLSGVIAGSLEAARPELQISAASDAIENAEVRIIGHVSSRTSFGQALLTNIVAWGFTLFVTVLILMVSRGPGPEETLSSAATKILGPEAPPALTNSN
jgi:hypothetical protein